MNVLNISLDPSSLDPESAVASRMKLYGKKAGTYISIVPTPAARQVVLSDEAMVYGSGGINKVVRYIKLFFLVRKIVKEKQIEVITSQDAYFLGFLGYVMARWYHLGLEIQVLGIEKLSWFRMRLARFVYRRTKVVRVLSHALMDRLEKEFGVAREKMIFIPIYVPVDRLGLNVRTLDQMQRSEYDALEADFTHTYGKMFNFLCVARQVEIKRLELPIRAIAELKKKYPHVRLHLVGDGPERQRLEALRDSLKLQDEVIFHGYKLKLELGLFYLQADCLVISSAYEGFGMTVVEAFTAGLPVVMTNVGCAGDLVIHEEGGLIVPVGDQSALTAAMERVLEDSALRNQLAEGAFAAIKNLPPLEEILNAYYASWQKALAHTL